MTNRVEKIEALKNLVAEEISGIVEAVYADEVSDLDKLANHQTRLTDLVKIYQAAEIAETTNKQGTYNLGNIL
ncbi:hypothetical protein [Phyllobacterium sp. SB3]|uniref:hypothetical protein n=1 Tax=Phyllobacterium sp. SB3 TaxID=3156073 RepID=UPI0032AF691E